MTKRGLIRTVVYLHQDERRALKLAAAERDVPASEIMREALRRHLGIED
ncbi:MAG: ribbon-helix-helix protein, CopG family [bacterium]|nr:ribbon-helix-helix protein, CopG family [bacterium]